jgi:hypothetical protein
MNLPLPLQFPAARIGVWLGRALQEQVDYDGNTQAVTGNHAVSCREWHGVYIRPVAFFKIDVRWCAR